MASGKPDLSGFYDSGTLTPLNRPEALGEKQFMTPAEAEQFKKLSGLLASDADEISDPNRSAPPKGGDGQQAYGAGGVGGYNRFGWIPAVICPSWMARYARRSFTIQPTAVSRR